VPLAADIGVWPWTNASGQGLGWWRWCDAYSLLMKRACEATVRPRIGKESIRTIMLGREACLRGLRGRRRLIGRHGLQRSSARV